MTISRKNMPLHVFIFESWWICPGISALFPGISAFFPGISAQKNRHIFTQSRVRSAQKARNPKLTTRIKKWPFPAPSQEIRPKGRNLGNGHLFVSFRRSRYICQNREQTHSVRLFICAAGTFLAAALWILLEHPGVSEGIWAWQPRSFPRKMTYKWWVKPTSEFPGGQ